MSGQDNDDSGVWKSESSGRWAEWRFRWAIGGADCGFRVHTIGGKTTVQGWTKRGGGSSTNPSLLATALSYANQLRVRDNYLKKGDPLVVEIHSAPMDKDGLAEGREIALFFECLSNVACERGMDPMEIDSQAVRAAEACFVAIRDSSAMDADPKIKPGSGETEWTRV